MIENPPPEAVVGLAQQVMPAALYLTELQFCELYQVAVRTAIRWRKEGRGPAFVRLGPRHIRYRLVDTEAWASARTFGDRITQQAA